MSSRLRRLPHRLSSSALAAIAIAEIVLAKRAALLMMLCAASLLTACAAGEAYPSGGRRTSPEAMDGGSAPSDPMRGASCDGCAPHEMCVTGVGCVVPGEPCRTNDDCDEDGFCEADLGRCVPYGGTRASDPMCARLVSPGAFSPTVQCEFDTAPPGDPFPLHVHVLGSPMVADFGIDPAPDQPPSPFIVAVFDDGEDGSSELATGVIRILDGRTCEQRWELGTISLVSHSSPPAIGDLDGDGRPEIVAYGAGGGLVAFRYDPVADGWVQHFQSTTMTGEPYAPTGGGWAGPSLYDLDDDGSPEILRAGLVFDAMGRLLDDSLAGEFGQLATGLFAVVADVDDDSAVEHVQGHGVWQWSITEQRWVPESWSRGGLVPGHVALADFGEYTAGAEGTGRTWASEAPEVVVVSPGAVRVQTLDGRPVFGTIAFPGGGSGGPPTVADFDGDGRPEFASAGLANYVVFDLDCGPNPIGRCESGREDGILWLRPSQDASSNRTGSSVFDFEGDGRAEVVYGDECFVRVYDGQTGDVLFSQARSSCTWYENPVIADVDGDFNAEIVIGNNTNCDVTCGNLDPGELDPLFAGIRCNEATDCLSGICDSGLCRCGADAECCTGDGCELAGLRCAAPPAGTPGAGNTCRASHPRAYQGIRVYSDRTDRWVRSRMIWNQHAYHVTNIADDGTVPRTSEARKNWQMEGLNNFRQNVQGGPTPNAAPDLTVSEVVHTCDAAEVMLRATVCNRGTEPVGDGVAVGFYADEASPRALCAAATRALLDPGRCEEVSCAFETESIVNGIEVYAVVDEGSAHGECWEGNNASAAARFQCGVM